MGLNQSIHDINIINAMNNGTDDSLPITNIQSVSNAISNMQQKYSIIQTEPIKIIIYLIEIQMLIYWNYLQ